MRLTLKFGVICLIALSSLLIKEARANQVVLCDNCASAGQFEYAAFSKHGTRRGWATYLVVNPYTESSMWVDVVYTPPGEVIMSSPEAADEEGFLQAIHFVISNDPAALVAFSAPESNAAIQAPPDEQVFADLAFGLQAGSSASARPVSNSERLEIQAVIRLSRDHVIVRPGPGTPGFESFADGQWNLKAVEDVIMIALTQNNPAWRYEEVNSNLVESLFNILEHLWGKGPSGCVVYDNADSACYQVNMMAPGLMRLLEGTAKDKNGNLISTSGGLPNRGGHQLDPRPHTPQSGWWAWVPSQGDMWLVCSYVGGKLHSCYPENAK